MSFFETLFALCEEKGIKPNSLVPILHISSGSVTAWKNGTIPNAKTLAKLAEYFGVSTDYLLGKTDIKNKPTAINGDELTKRQKEYLAKIDRMTPEQLKMLDIFINGLEKEN